MSYRQLKQVEFVGHLINPKFSRGKAPGEAARLASGLRNQRVKIHAEALRGGGPGGREGLAAEAENARAERARKRVEKGVGDRVNGLSHQYLTPNAHAASFLCRRGHSPHEVPSG